MNKRSVFILFAFVMALMVMPVQAAQLLPASSWYAIVHQPETDILQWVNAGGVQATIARPQLPNEAQFLDLRVSPNGQSMVMVSQLNGGLEALGIYDFATASFVQIHQAQVGEHINLGGENIYTANSQYFAIGFFSGDFNSPAWRVILFEAQTGNVTAFIDHTHPDAPEVQLSAPAVQYLDGTYVHFQLIPQSVGGWHTWPAYAWRAFGFDPSQPSITESPYSRADVQIQPLTGMVTMTVSDENYAIAPQDGQTPNFNAVAAGVIANGNPLTTIHANGTRYHLQSRWAKGGEWILFLSTDALGNRYWNNVLANGTPGNNSHMPFDPQYIKAYGTSDGYLLINNANTLFYSNGFMPNTAISLALLSPASKVVYVTPIGINFMLNQLPETGEQIIVTQENPQIVITPTTLQLVTPQAPIDCSLAPAQRVSIGIQARVVPAMSGLNLRQNPNGGIIQTLSGGDTFKVIGGAICDGGLYWWQIDRNGAIGWLAEGTSTGYYIEAYAGDPVPPAQEEPDVVVVVPEAQFVCGSALTPRLKVGGSASVVASSLNVYNGPNGEVIPLTFLEAGTVVKVTAGPECSNGQNWWLVSGLAKKGRIGNRTESVQAWVPESVSNSYNLAP